MSSGLNTDRYELTMIGSALRDGTADRPCVFEVFARRLPEGRRYGVVGGTARVLDEIAEFTFDQDTLEFLRAGDVIDDATADYLSEYRFGGDIDGYPEGELYFPLSPILTVSGTFAEAVILETLVLSILNHDSAVASAAARMVSAAGGRPIIEMGSRRTHEQAAVAAARAAYLAGFASTSNLAASRSYGVPTAGTAAHAFVLLHDSEAAAFQAQVDSLGTGTTLLVDTYDIARGIEHAVSVSGTGLGAIRIDSGELGITARHAREQLDRLGATGTSIVVSGDLDEFAIAALAAAPVDAYGAGTAVVTGSGAPTAGFVYKLVEVDGRPVAKRSEHKESHGGRKTVLRAHKPSGTALEEIVVSGTAPEPGEGERPMQRPFMRGGVPVDGLPTLAESRQHLRAATVTLPWDGLKLSRGEPAIPTRVVRGGASGPDQPR
ncbi:nicotinate phosphoribosyltransferase [Jatrophihabitans sp.]|uniref:nicotinate phosphoribosyltransferase n=1 Tax=Jatrophihabitans sp. TaxID=1932789 RepID=UPI0030C66633|nr:Nicotinate phosphoribosyltransferase [Jatrophihabitans sp.]